MSSQGLTIPPGASPSAIIKMMRRHYVQTDRDKAVRLVLDSLFERDDSGTQLPVPARFGQEQETHGLIVIGESGAGKTTALAQNLRTHPALTSAVVARDATNGVGPLLKIDVPSPTTLKTLGLEILRQTRYGDVARSRTEAEVWTAVRHRLKVCGICVLWLDEAQDVMRSGSEAEITKICNTIKTLCKGDHAVIVILSGIDTLAYLPRFDPQIDSRFAKLWLDEVSPSKDGKGIYRLIETYCAGDGLKPPPRGDLVLRLFHSCRNRLGKSIERVIDAIELALLNKDNALTIQHFAQAYAIKEGCRPTRNIFMIDAWASVDPANPDGDGVPVINQPKKKSKKAGKS